MINSFDRFAAQHYANAALLGKQMVLGWINEQLEEKRQNLAAKTTAMKFGALFSLAFVTGLSIAEQPLHDAENMLCLRSDGRLLPLPAFNLTLGASRIVFTL